MAKDRHQISIAKQNIRKIALHSRAALPQEYRNTASSIISKQILKYLDHTQIVAVYYAINTEVDIALCISKLFNMKKTIALPFVSSEPYIFVQWNKHDKLIENHWKIPEPDLSSSSSLTPDIVIVPMLAFDKNHNRLGYGFGCYDRLLQSLPTIKIGIAFAAQEVKCIPSNEHDIKMNMIITEKEILRN